MKKELNDLECMKIIADYFYEDTKDEWYENVSKQIEMELKQK